MLFNSYSFIFAFLPATAAVFFWAERFGAKAQVYVLAAASLIFYCGWDIRYLPLLLVSVCFNFSVGWSIVRARSRERATNGLLAFGVLGNLLVLGYYKYVNFFIDTANDLGASLPALDVILPLGISFFTFTQLAFLVDAHRGKTDEPQFVEYLTFVTYFPHLIAGPIIHHHETIPQLRQRHSLRSYWVGPGLALFSIGLAKKVLIADTFGYVARPIFAGFAAAPGTMTGADAWLGALCYTFQLYFDFSAYSDMAVGVSLMLGIYIPLNFDSPYKATSIIDFWRRWHMTLSRYLREYLYIPLGGNRHGSARRYLNLFVTMLIGGFWHGAGWVFIIWGGLHGLYLIANHAWRTVRRETSETQFSLWFGRLLTFLAVMVAWVFFRSENVPDALGMLSAMAFNQAPLSSPIAANLTDTLVPASLIDAAVEVPVHLIAGALIVAGLGLVWGFPNSQEIVFRHLPWIHQLDKAPAPVEWTPRRWLAPLAAICFTGTLIGLIAAPPGEFLYFNF